MEKCGPDYGAEGSAHTSRQLNKAQLRGIGCIDPGRRLRSQRRHRVKIEPGGKDCCKSECISAQLKEQAEWKQSLDEEEHQQLLGPLGKFPVARFRTFADCQSKLRRQTPQFGEQNNRLECCTTKVLTFSSSTRKKSYRKAEPNSIAPIIIGAMTDAPFHGCAGCPAQEIPIKKIVRPANSKPRATKSRFKNRFRFDPVFGAYGK